jgi:hypothetical protein
MMTAGCVLDPCRRLDLRSENHECENIAVNNFTLRIFASGMNLDKIYPDIS